MTARMPGATFRELPQNRTQPLIKPVGVVLHTAVSDGKSLYSFFNGRSAGVESHFYVNESGAIEQYLDADRRADCQLDGNSWLSGGTRYGFLSIETWDGGKPESNPWNAKQLDAINRIIRWAADRFDFPVVKATGAHGHGIGYHAQFTNGSPTWNHSHSCPGSLRIKQVPGIIARAASKETPTEADKLTPTQAHQLQVLYDLAPEIRSIYAALQHIQAIGAAADGKEDGHSAGYFLAHILDEVKKASK